MTSDHHHCLNRDSFSKALSMSLSVAPVHENRKREARLIFFWSVYESSQTLRGHLGIRKMQMNFLWLSVFYLVFIALRLCYIKVIVSFCINKKIQNIERIFMVNSIIASFNVMILHLNSIWEISSLLKRKFILEYFTYTLFHCLSLFLWWLLLVNFVQIIVEFLITVGSNPNDFPFSWEAM